MPSIRQLLIVTIASLGLRQSVAADPYGLAGPRHLTYGRTADLKGHRDPEVRCPAPPRHIEYTEIHPIFGEGDVLGGAIAPLSPYRSSDWPTARVRTADIKSHSNWRPIDIDRPPPPDQAQKNAP